MVSGFEIPYVKSGSLLRRVSGYGASEALGLQMAKATTTRQIRTAESLQVSVRGCLGLNLHR